MNDLGKLVISFAFEWLCCRDTMWRLSVPRTAATPRIGLGSFHVELSI